MQFQAKTPQERTCNLGVFLSQEPFSWDDCGTGFLLAPEQNFATTNYKRLLLQEFQSIFSFHELIAKLCCHQTFKPLLEMFVSVHSTKTQQKISHSWDQMEPQATTSPINTCASTICVWKCTKVCGKANSDNP